MTDQTTVRLVALADEMQERAIQAELMADKLSRMYGEIQNQLLAVTAERDALKETLKWKHAYWPKRVTELEAERDRLREIADAAEALFFEWGADNSKNWDRLASALGEKS